jgi:hypothetical protein
VSAGGIIGRARVGVDVARHHEELLHRRAERQPVRWRCPNPTRVPTSRPDRR